MRVEGARELRASMKRAGEDLGELKNAHREVASQVARATQPPRLTGRLAGNVRPGASATAAMVRAGGARVPYAGPIHWGWPARGIAAQPFIVDAAQRTETEWTATYQADVDRLLQRVEGA